jgi:cell wall-associated NlpC family hydrolase
MTNLARSSFTLNGPSIKLDPRINAVRGDLADVSLAETWFAPHYAAPVARSVSIDRVAVREKPDDAATMVSELLKGEGFELLDVSGGWAWGYCTHDHYVGYVKADALNTERAVAPTRETGDVASVAETYIGTPYV